MAKRIAVIILIYLLATTAWVTLGSSIIYRTGSSSRILSDEVEALWGTA